MTRYVLKITDAAVSDMASVYGYIANDLCAPDTAMQQYDRIAAAVESLATFPERCPLLQSQPERSLGIRQLPVNRYSIFYVVQESTVTVLRVLYSASDINHRLTAE